MQRIKRLEAGDSSQARGMDTQAMLPVLAMVAELIAMLGFRWVSVPDLRYSPYAQAGMLWKLEETAKGIAWNYQVPEARLFMEYGDDGGCPVVGDRYQYGTEPFGGA